MSDGRVRYARNGSVRLAYREFGEGDTTLVWNPGWFSSVEMWDDPASPFGAMVSPGEVLTSRTVRDLSAGSGLTFESLGMQHLKGLAEDTEVFKVSTQTGNH
jgi:pimeloyl-ACP methyl ester carboxylesterase